MKKNKNVINNPGGRKPLPEDERLEYSITVRYTGQQMKRIRRKAGSLPLRVYIRESSLNSKVQLPLSREDMQKIRDLNKCGTNINDLDRRARAYGFHTVADKCDEVMQEMQRIIHKATLTNKPKA